MSERKRDQRLGRGLAALIGDLDNPADSAPALVPDRTLAVADVRANPLNPRRTFHEDDLADLAASIATHGVVQPIVVRRSGDKSYELIAGERRWRAAQRAGIDRIPAVVRDVDDREALEIAIVENVQRADLDAIEEAEGYRLLMDTHEYTQGDLSQVVGKSRSHVANTLRLLHLPKKVRAFVSDGLLTSGHARALVGREDAEPMAERIVRDDLSVRQVEELVRRPVDPPRKPPRSEDEGSSHDADRAALEKRLGEALGLRVALRTKGRGEGVRGSLKIDFRSLEQLDDVCERLLGSG